jgi:hypothetical protein
MVLEGRQLTLNGMVYFHDERFTRDKIVCVTACSGGVCVRLCVCACVFAFLCVCVRACVRLPVRVQAAQDRADSHARLEGGQAAG